MAQWHSVDLTNFDVAPIARRAQRTTKTAGKKLVGLAKEATYIGVGVGLLSFQRAQVQRREIERSLRG